MASAATACATSRCSRLLISLERVELRGRSGNYKDDEDGHLNERTMNGQFSLAVFLRCFTIMTLTTSVYATSCSDDALIGSHPSLCINLILNCDTTQ